LKKVLITGATGLLGKKLVEVGLEQNLSILAQYHKKRPESAGNCRWIQADFSRPQGITNFLEENRADLSGCHYLINNYGPINPKSVSDLTSGDFCRAFHHNTLTAIEIIRFLIQQGSLESVVSIGFENLAKIMPFRDVLSYAVAKNGLLLATLSYARHYSGIRFNMVSPVTLTGAREILKNGRQVSPRLVAEKIYAIMTGNRSGLNMAIP
jgi:NAD(P)-dependent dehydrogenase (short-subunit alcohol dehydrogenase family)